MLGAPLNTRTALTQSGMRLPLASQYTLLLLISFSARTMSVNPLHRIARSLYLARSGPTAHSYAFVTPRQGPGSPANFVNRPQVNAVNSYPNFNAAVNTVSTTYPVGYNAGNQTVPSFTPVPNYNVMPTQYGFQPGPMQVTGFNSFGSNPYVRPRFFNNYARRYNTGYRRQSYRRFSSQGPSNFEFPLANIDWSSENLVEIKKDFYDLSYEADSRSGEEIERILSSHNIIIEGEHPLPKPVNTFDEAVFNEPIQKIIRESKFSEPTPIQKVGWTSCLTGRDVVGVSQTGSGKTLTFLLPGILHLMAQPPVGNRGGPIMLVIAPTRELCLQIADEARSYANMLNLRLVTVYGGSSKYTQLKECENGVEIMVATPGRLLEFLSTGSIKLNRVSYFVMDEADRMLDMGFEPQIRKIFSQIRPDRQTLMFSATWPTEIRRLASEFCKPDFIYIQVGDLELTANKNITQTVKMLNSYEIKDSLFNFLNHLPPDKKVLIFSDLKSFADQLAGTLRYRKFRASSLHGDKSQSQRERILNMFRTGEYNILVATDVAARGLDIKDIDYVVNLDAPKSLLDYIHRIGRTARGGSKGESLLYFAKDTLTQTKVKFAQELAAMLLKVNQPVPPELTQIANNFK